MQRTLTNNSKRIWIWITFFEKDLDHVSSIWFFLLLPKKQQFHYLCSSNVFFRGRKFRNNVSICMFCSFVTHSMSSERCSWLVAVVIDMFVARLGTTAFWYEQQKHQDNNANMIFLLRTRNTHKCGKKCKIFGNKMRKM